MPMTPDSSTDAPLDSDLEDDESAAPITVKLNPEFCGVRLDKALSSLIPQYSRSRLQQWIDQGFVTIDGQPARGKATVYGDESVTVLPQLVESQQPYQPEPMTLDIVHEDATLLVINKPAGMVVHPGAGNWSGTLLNGLLHYCPALAVVPRAGIVHRLDKDTTGLMVVAKTLAAQADLVRQLQARTVQRDYLALTWGTTQPSGMIDAPIGRHPRDRVKMAVVGEDENGKPAVTRYHRLATGMLSRIPVSLVRCQLETGRTHQIRVHMQSVGFPLVGDSVYGKRHLVSAFPRQALHACRLGLLHPRSGKPRSWTAPLPEDMKALLAQAGIAEPEL
ncbi:RluA family pseudouridine synthase [Lacisediminimonas profundi]|uniref:RluA family pseudouridine synthase n=1 Tax=Lacisediminimonas profundi TaxID=2603856 RepID=UPI00124AE4C8|nr:RluA family pseudouridine synthase [Lacisediminimonas profundi]